MLTFPRLLLVSAVIGVGLVVTLSPARATPPAATCETVATMDPAALARDVAAVIGKQRAAGATSTTVAPLPVNRAVMICSW